MLKFWKEQEDSFRKEPVIEGTGRELSATQFHLAAKHNVKRLNEAAGYAVMNFPFQNALRLSIMREFKMAS